jgi:copper chaperone CopZ
MKNLILLITLFLTLSLTGFAQIKNAMTKTVRIYGNCFMCKAQIEKAGNQKNIAEVDWNLQTQIATVTYDSKMTTANKILKRIALAGFDNDRYLAPDAAYKKLEQCCRYERIAKYKYECVMCKTTSEKPGKCPVCNMQMTIKKKINSNK